MNYRCSVLTSVYNGEKYLFDFLMDVKRQTMFEELEVLLLDANDNDANYNIIKDFLHHDNFKYIKLGKCNVYEAWNKGLEVCTAPILTNWNIDDRREFSSLNYQVSYMEENPEIDLCFGGLFISQKPNETFEFNEKRLAWHLGEGKMEDMLEHNSPHCMPVWRKDVHDKYGNFDEKYFCAADYEMWLRILKNGGKFKKLDKMVGLYYENPASVSRNIKNIYKASEEVFQVQKVYQ